MTDAPDVLELGDGEVVEPRDEGVDLGAEGEAVLRISDAVGLVGRGLAEDVLEQIVELGRGPDKAGRAFSEGKEVRVFGCEARDGKLIYEKEREMRCNLLTELVVHNKTIENSTKIKP